MPPPSRLPGLRLSAGEQVLEVHEPRVVRVGRAAESDLVLLGRTVSRHHVELRPVEQGWVLVDTGGQLGTWVDGARVEELVLTGPTTVQCGPPGGLSAFQVEQVEQVEPVGPDGPASSRPGPEQDGLAETTVLAAVRADEAGPDEGGGGGAGVPGGPGLLVVAEGREHRFAAPRALVVGRHPDCDVVLTDPTCSRVHGRLEPGPSRWRWTTVSERGAWADGRRVTVRDLADPVTLRLGHPTAGPELRLVPVLPAAAEQRRLARRRWRRRLLAVAAVAAVAVVVGSVAGAVVLLGDDPASPGGRGGAGGGGVLTDAELDGAKLATVRLTATTTDTTGAEVVYSGSGSVIDAGGLVLTNAHVAAPATDGLAASYDDPAALLDPDYLLVSLVDTPDGAPQEPAYRARVVVADGALDAAVLEVYADADGSALDEAPDLPTLELGESGDLRTGDDVTVLGFPTIAGSAAVSVTRGVVSTFVSDPDLGPRAEIDTDARIAPGNSGGAAIDDDARVIGIPSALYFEEGTAVVSGRIRPIDLVAGLVEQAREVSDAG